MDAMNLPRVATPPGEPPPAWARILDSLHHTFLPVVKMRTGRVHGVEAVLGGFEHTPFADAADLIESADAEGCLAAVQAALHRRAIDACRRDGGRWPDRLFLNIDVRALERLPATWRPTAPAAGPIVVLEIAQRVGGPAGGRPTGDVETLIQRLRDGGVGVGLDDFGSGFAGPRLLYVAQPDYVKIDSFFIAGIDRDLRKRAIVHALIGYAGSTVRAAEMFHETFPNLGLTVLVDYFGREVSDGLEVCRRFPELAASGKLSVRLDTPGGRFVEGLDPPGSYAVLERHAPHSIRGYRDETQLRYLIGTGVSAAAVYHMREKLDDAGFPAVKIVVSSGFNPAKCHVMAEANAPIDIIGTGSYLPERWTETYATADIIEYDGEKRVKVGREFLFRKD